MITRPRYLTRPATYHDLNRLGNLVHFEAHVHRHLDYRPALDWVGSYPFIVLEHQSELAAALACPPDPPRVAWLRLFAVGSRFPVEETWEMLWQSAREELVASFQPDWAAAIPMQNWFRRLLDNSGFVETHQIVMLNWEMGHLPFQPPTTRAKLRPMEFEDLPMVEAVDRASFVPVWQNSLGYLQIAFRQSAVATLAEVDGEVVGYQVSTPTPLGGHLARLAVLPEMQGGGIGYALVYDALVQFKGRGARCVTVNTQKDNRSSLAIYRKAGFQMTGEEYPVYQLAIGD